MLKKERQKTFSSNSQPGQQQSHHHSQHRGHGGHSQGQSEVNGYHSQAGMTSADTGGRRSRSSRQDRPDSESQVDRPQGQVRGHPRSSVAAIDKEDRMKTKICELLHDIVR